MLTPLYEWHVAHKATMVDFAGWKMPIHYGSQLEEHHAVRQHAGIFDVSHMNVVDVIGQDVPAYLKILCANNIEKLSPNKALYTCMLNENGGIVDDLIVYKISDSHYRLVLNAGTREKDLHWLNHVKGSFELHLHARSEMAIIALQGPHAITIAKSLFQIVPEKFFSFIGFEDCMIARTGYTGEDGVEIIVPGEHALKIWNKLIDAGAKPIGLGARDTLRLEAGLNLYSSDMDETVSPLESNIAWTVAWEPADRQFMGRKTLEIQKQIGISKKLVGLTLEKGGVLRHGQKIFSQDQEIGVVTSGGFSPTLNVSIAMARIDASVAHDVDVEIRGKRLPARVVALPFIKRK
ncbi:MAG: glycine cleavage system aminomethyltransferase GcvT [Gammaproteobacteria bacterium]|nr:glycine cleavage system aminomethyltransferase GcvT [Gammaproteobacteria bacterium]